MKGVRSAALRPQPKNHKGTEDTDAQVLASFAPKFTRRGGRELLVSRQGAKLAKQMGATDTEILQVRKASFCGFVMQWKRKTAVMEYVYYYTLYLDHLSRGRGQGSEGRGQRGEGRGQRAGDRKHRTGDKGTGGKRRGPLGRR